MADELYDEFGNYIGPELDDDSENEDEDEYVHESDRFADERHGGGDFGVGGGGQLVAHSGDGGGPTSMEEEDDGGHNGRIVLHEDKKYYPDASEVYPGVRTVTLDQDAQDLSEPIIKPVVVKNFSVLEKEAPSLTYSTEFMTALMQAPTNSRNVAVIGHLHHGKTLFLDSLVKATQEKTFDPAKELRYTDTRKDEQQRQLSIKSTPLTLVLENFDSKSHVLNILDCPGHVNFSDETTAGLRAVDGVVVVIDAVEGVMLGTERVIRQAVAEDVDICVMISKMDRLVVELKLPPTDAYFKILHTLEEVNKIIHDCAVVASTAVGSGYRNNVTPKRISPELGNVCFSSGQHGWSFTLQSFAERYCAQYNAASAAASSSSSAAAAAIAALQNNATQNTLNAASGLRTGKGTAGCMDPTALAKRLWGDWYHDEARSAFTKSTSSAASKALATSGTPRTFIKFILEPIYKIYSQVLGEDPESLVGLVRKLHIRLTSAELHLDPKPLLNLICSRYFGYPCGFVDMCLRHVVSPVEGNARKVRKHYNGDQTGPVATSMVACDPNGPLMVHTMKLYNTPDGQKFLALGRIYSGTIRAGQRVRVLGESFVLLTDEEEVAAEEVQHLSVSVGRFSIEVNCAVAGNWVMIEGVDSSIKKTATITDAIGTDDVEIFKPLKFDNLSMVKVAIEPLQPVELPKMLDAMRKISKSYPLAATKVEESGEHVIIGTGELYMDCIMHDLRHLYSDIEVKISDPVVAFCETVVETSAFKCYADTPNHRNRLTMLCEPLESGLSADIEADRIMLNWDKKDISEFFCGRKYEWDLMASRSVWAFGPEEQSPNMLVDDTLASEVNKKLLHTVKDSIIHGFKWGCREGPLCEEPIRNVKFKLLNATIAAEPIHRGGGQIIPTARRVAYSSFLMATPRLMEPVYLVQIQAPVDVIPSLYPVLARRRGHVVQDAPKPGTPFYTVKAYIPVMDSFGFETDVRSYTQGQAFCTQTFDHWSVVPGDPLDSNVILHMLEPSPPLALAKDFMIKTRRRKGLNEEVLINKYIDDATLLEQVRAHQQLQMDQE